MQCTETLWLKCLGLLENTGSSIFKKIENTVYARFTEELLQLIFKIIKTNIKSTAILASYEIFFRNLSSLLRSLIYLSLLISFLFLSRFSVFRKSLDNYFFRRFAYSLFLADFLISYNMWSSYHFSIYSCFPCFSGSGSRVQSPGSRSRF